MSNTAKFTLMEQTALMKEIEKLIQDTKWAAAEGGSEYDEVRSRYGQFFVHHGAELLAALPAHAERQTATKEEK